MHRTVTYRILKARREDLARLDEVLDMCRQLYNAALQERRDAWAIEENIRRAERLALAVWRDG